MMETRFIEGGEYVDRKTYIETRDENSRLRERIEELERICKTEFDDLSEGDYSEWVDVAGKQRITELEAQRAEGRQLVHDWSAECERLQARLEAVEGALIARYQRAADKLKEVREKSDNDALKHWTGVLKAYAQIIEDCGITALEQKDDKKA